jgi:hypothetical protein
MHPKYLGVGSELEAGCEIVFAGSAQRDPLTYQSWEGTTARLA